MLCLHLSLSLTGTLTSSAFLSVLAEILVSSQLASAFLFNGCEQKCPRIDFLFSSQQYKLDMSVFIGA